MDINKLKELAGIDEYSAPLPQEAGENWDTEAIFSLLKNNDELEELAQSAFSPDELKQLLVKRTDMYQHEYLGVDPDEVNWERLFKELKGIRDMSMEENTVNEEHSETEKVYDYIYGRMDTDPEIKDLVMGSEDAEELAYRMTNIIDFMDLEINEDEVDWQVVYDELSGNVSEPSSGDLLEPSSGDLLMDDEQENWETKEAHRIIDNDDHLHNITMSYDSAEELRDYIMSLVTVGDLDSFSDIDTDEVDWEKVFSDIKGFEEDIDINNGYRNRQSHQEMGDHGDDYFPQGQTSTPQKRLGPSAAKHGNNAMYAKQFAEDSEDIHKNLVYEYRKFKKESLTEEDSMKHIYSRIIDEALLLLNDEDDNYDVNDVVRIIYEKYRDVYGWLDFDDLLFDVKARASKKQLNSGIISYAR